MSETTSFVIVLIVIIAVFSIIFALDHRAKTKGSMFTKRANVLGRVVAFILGLVFLALFLFELTSAELVTIAFPVVAGALFAYSFGVEKILRKLQAGDQSDLHTPVASQVSTIRRISRLCLMLATGIVVLVIVFYGSLWILGNPTAGAPVIIGLLVGFLVLAPLHYFYQIRSLYQKLRK